MLNDQYPLVEQATKRLQFGTRELQLHGPSFILGQLVDQITGYVIPHAAKHSHHVANLSMYLALSQRVPFHERLAKQLWYAAELHDIGKLGILSELWNLPRKLTGAEFDFIKAHTRIGESICLNLGLPQLVTDVVRSHHERWDGSGYPDGLVEGHIPVPAQIVAIADVYDALTNDRVYRRAYSPKDALEIIQEKPHKFNPDLIDVLPGVIREMPGDPEWELT